MFASIVASMLPLPCHACHSSPHLVLRPAVPHCVRSVHVAIPVAARPARPLVCPRCERRAKSAWMCTVHGCALVCKGRLAGSRVRLLCVGRSCSRLLYTTIHHPFFHVCHPYTTHTLSHTHRSHLHATRNSHAVHHTHTALTTHLPDITPPTPRTSHTHHIHTTPHPFTTHHIHHAPHPPH